jgi:hypothetical protein
MGANAGQLRWANERCALLHDGLKPGFFSGHIDVTTAVQDEKGR